MDGCETVRSIVLAPEDRRKWGGEGEGRVFPEEYGSVAGGKDTGERSGSRLRSSTDTRTPDLDFRTYRGH